MCDSASWYRPTKINPVGWAGTCTHLFDIRLRVRGAGSQGDRSLDHNKIRLRISADGAEVIKSCDRLIIRSITTILMISTPAIQTNAKAVECHVRVVHGSSGDHLRRRRVGQC